MHIDEQIDEDEAPVFKLGDLETGRLHTTRLKQHHFIDMRAQKKDRDVLLAFEEDVGFALVKACESDSDTDLACAAKVIYKQQ